jgi:CRP/FNR family cyclic AMP-dependent transcriptional regulator
MARGEVLGLVDIFADLNAAQLDLIHDRCIQVTFRQGDVIFNENSPSDEFYVIIDGEVEIKVDPSIISPNQEPYEPVTITTLRQGQSFGEIALVDRGLRSATAQCSSESCCLLMIKRLDFLDLLEQDRQIGFIVMSNLAADLCFKIRQANFQLRAALLYSPSAKRKQ